MKAALLPDRGVVKVAGNDARAFLNGLLTTDVNKVAPGQARFGALLTPQGKIIADCIVAEAPAVDGGGFFLDTARAPAPALVTKLNFYKLRAKVVCEDLSGTLGVLAAWDGNGTTGGGLLYADPRLPQLGIRIMLPPDRAPEAAANLGAELLDASAYEAHRIALGVPRGGLDFTYGDAFPHETDMDQLAGIDFDKGCYVGQEVVSRMQHRGTARSRIVPVTAAGGFVPDAGMAVMAGDKTVGTIGSHVGANGLALLRLDRVADARAAGLPLMAGGIVVEPRKPAWANFDWPGETG
jgi:folate-binding protein YgfZ